MLIYLYIRCYLYIMKKFLRNLIQYMLGGFLVLSLLRGVSIPTNGIYLIATLFILAITVFLASAILNFLTIRENFITSFIMTLLLGVGTFFLIQQFMPGFNIEVYEFEGINTGNLVIHPFTITVLITMVIGSFSHSLISSIFKVLEKTS